MNRQWAKSIRLFTFMTALMTAIPFRAGMGIDDNSYLKTDFGIVAREGIADTIEPGRSNSHEILINRAAKVNLCCHWGEGDLGMKLIDPAGNVIDSATHPAKYDIDFFQAKAPQISFATACYSITGDYPDGVWIVEISLPNSAGEKVDYSIGLYYEEPELDINTAMNKQYPKTEEPMTIMTALKRGPLPVLNAEVIAIIGFERQPIDTLILYDDGKHDDSLANDGRYAFEYLIPPRTGYYSVGIFAKKGGDDAFDRIDETAFITVANKTTIGEPVSEQVFDTTGEGLYDQLIIGYSFKIAQDDYYELQARLYDSNNKMIFNARTDTVLSPGIHIINFDFDGNRIYENGIDGPYVFESVVISDTTDAASILNYIENSYVTKGYSYRNFQHGAIIYSGNQSIKEMDVDGDGLIDSLVYSFEIDLLKEGDYRWQGQLHEPESLRPVGFADNSDYVKSGISSVTLSFAGSEIRKRGIDGPYEIWAVVFYPQGGSGPINEFEFRTREYKHTDFE
jgi:hypothetical protein